MQTGQHLRLHLSRCQIDDAHRAFVRYLGTRIDAYKRPAPGWALYVIRPRTAPAPIAHYRLITDQHDIKWRDANIEGAQAAGWRTIHVVDVETALNELDAELAT